MSDVTVRIPTPLRNLTEGKDEVIVQGNTVLEILENLDQLNPGFSEKIFDPDNKIRSFINIYLNEDNIRSLKGLESKVSGSATLSIIPAVAGGSR